MPIEIPSTLQKEEFRFVKLRDGKRPFENEWQTKNNYKYNDTSLLEWIKLGGNYGVVCGYGGLIVIDADTHELREKITNYLPKTFTVKTGGGGNHFYFICPELDKKIVLIKNNVHYGEVQSTGAQVVGAGCIHPNGNVYNILNNGGITKINKEDILSAIYDFEETKKREIDDIKRENKEFNNLKITDIISTSGMKRRGNELYGSHPIHGSDTGMNFYVNDVDNVWHCFRCGSGGNALHWIAVQEGLLNCHDCKRGCLKGEMFKHVLKLAREKYKIIPDETLLKKTSLSYKFEDQMNNALGVFNDFIKLSKEFLEIQPLYYDSSRIWWCWDFEEYKWKMVDETDIMIMIDKNLKTESRTTNSVVKNEIIEALKRASRDNRPNKMKESWIQFKDKIMDVDTGEEVESSSRYFSTNSINWSLGKTTETPILDKIFEEWVGKEHVNKLYEIIAYSMSSSYFMHRIFCFVGSGNNGKSTFFNVIKKLIGVENTTSTELDDLLFCRFEKAKLFKKLVCFMGETNFGTMKNTSILKKLTGQDLIGFEFKNKDPFDDENYAKIFIATNTIPMTLDKTRGFYRRWIIIDFPYDFEGKERNIMEEIPDEEYMNLAKKSVEILKTLRTTKRFTDEGSTDDKTVRFEKKSNPLIAFVNEKCVKDPFEEMPFWEFFETFKSYLGSNGQRGWSKFETSQALKTEGFEFNRKNIDKYDGSRTTQIFIIGIRMKTDRQTSIIDEPETNL